MSVSAGGAARLIAALVVSAILVGGRPAEARPASGGVVTVPGMPPVVDPRNLYSEAGANKLSPRVAGALDRVYVPHVRSNDVYVIDPSRMKVVARFHVGRNPQHIVPSYDRKEPHGLTVWPQPGRYSLGHTGNMR